MTYYCTYVVSIEFHIVLGFGVVGKDMDFLRMKQIIGQIFVFPKGKSVDRKGRITRHKRESWSSELGM